MCLCHLAKRGDPAYLKGFAEPIILPDDQFGEVMRRFDRLITEIARDFADGRLDPIGFEEAMSEALRAMHPDSNYAGQEMADYLPPSKTLARTRGLAVAVSEVQYLRGFALALSNRDPRYWDEDAGEWRSIAIEARSRSYMGRGRGSATDGWGLASGGVNTIVNWSLGAVEEHCEDCPIMAAGGPWLLYGSTGQFEYPTLGFLPGENRTPCMMYCECRIQRLSDGMQSPAPFRFDTAA